jgi:hypothetical protein
MFRGRTSTGSSSSEQAEDLPAGHGGQIRDPNVNDVLSGRGGRINSHPGNVQFRTLVHQYKHTYLSKVTKKLDKVKIASQIVSTIRSMDPSGRFLKEDAKTHAWIEIGDEKARKKAGQAMREKADETRKEIEHTEFPAGQQGNNWPQAQDIQHHQAQNMQQQQTQNMQQQGYHGGNVNVQNQFGNNYGQNQFGNNGGADFQQQQAPGGGYGGGAQNLSNFEALAAANGQVQQFGNHTSHTHQLQHATSMPMPVADANRRRQHASILKGNAVAFDQEFHKLRNSDSSGSRVHSLATSGVSSMRDSSGSSLMSMLSSGVLSQNELLQLALLQQQSGQMAPLDESLEWSDKWDQASLDMVSQELQRQSAMMGAGVAPGSGVGNGAGNGVGLQPATGGTSVHSGMTDSNKRRMFQQNREQSHTYLPSDLKGTNGNANTNFRASHLMNASIETLGSTIMGPPHMSSMGMGSTNMMMPVNAGNSQMNNFHDQQRPEQLRVENMQNRLAGMGLDPLLVSDNSLMIMLAEAAANSESIGSTFSFGKSSMGQETFPGPTGALITGSIPSESGSAVLLSHLNQGNNIPVALAPTAPDLTDSMPQHPSSTNNTNLDMHINGDGNLHQNAVPSTAVASMSMQPPIDVSERVLPVAREVQFHPASQAGNNNMQSIRGDFDPIAQTASIEETSPLNNDDIAHQIMKKPTQRGVSRAMSGLSTKSDISMGETSWYNEVRNQNSLRTIGDSGNLGDSRLRLFSENSTRYVYNSLHFITWHSLYIL